MRKPEEGGAPHEKVQRRGTTFKIYLPRGKAAAERPSPRPVSPASLCGSETVLVVEDAEAVRNLTRNVLVAHGYAVLAAAGAQEALRPANEHDGPIQRLVTDVVMRGRVRESRRRSAPTRAAAHLSSVQGVGSFHQTTA